MQKENFYEKDYKIKAYKQRETFISTINHDLKIPALAQIRAMELLLSENLGILNQNQKEIVSLTLESCRAMYSMLSAILSSYKYENKDIILDLEDIDITKIISDCINANFSILQSKNINCKIFSDNKNLNVIADRIQIKKALINLINYCLSKTVNNSKFLCKTEKFNKNIVISLIFKNPFTDVEKMENMFNMYTTSAEKLDKVGTGLRLYLAKQIITAHKGTVSFDKTKSKNICSIVLPGID